MAWKLAESSAVAQGQALCIMKQYAAPHTKRVFFGVLACSLYRHFVEPSERRGGAGV